MESAVLLWRAYRGRIRLLTRRARQSPHPHAAPGRYADEVVTGTSPSIFYTGSFGTFSANVVGGVTLSSPTALDLSSGSISTATGGTLVITLTEDGVMDPTGMTEWLQQFVGTFIPGAGISVSSIDSVDGALLSTLTCTATPCSRAKMTDMSSGISGPYTMTEVITIVSKGANSFSLDQNLVGRALVTAVAEPGSLLLLAIGLLALRAIGARRRVRGAH